MKKVNFNIALTGFDGTTLKDQEGKDIFIKTLIANKIGAIQHGTSFEETLTKFELAKKILRSMGEINLSEDDVNLIKKNLDGLTVLTAGQILELLK